MFNLLFNAASSSCNPGIISPNGAPPKEHPSMGDIGSVIYHTIQKVQSTSFLTMYHLYSSIPASYHLIPDKSAKEIVMTHDEIINFENGYHAIVSSHDRVLEKTAKIFEAIHTNIKDAELQQWMVAEILAKIVARIPLDKGQLISIPVINGEGKSEMVTYEVDKCFDLGLGIPAYGLKPHAAAAFSIYEYLPFFGSCHKESVKAAPLLLFRGTNFSVKTEAAKMSVAINFDPKGAGFSFFLNAKDAIHQWLQSVTSASQKARVFGYSQGGAFAQYTAINENAFISQKSHEPSMIFNSPGVNKDLLQQWHNIPAEQKPNLCALLPSQDPVTQFGFLLGSVVQFNPKQPQEVQKAHFPLMLSQDAYSLVPVDTEKENSSMRRHYFTQFQGKLDEKIQAAVKQSLDELGESYYPSATKDGRKFTIIS